MGEELTRWSVRLALLLYFAFALVRMRGRRHDSLARALWTAGCLLYLAHVGLAFGFYHHFSHAEAYRHTALRSRETVGLEWGGGLYFNYAFTALWMADVLWWWLSPESYNRRPGGLQIALHTFMLFIIFNATVVFESGPTRWTAVAALVVLLVCWVKKSQAQTCPGRGI